MRHSWIDLSRHFNICRRCGCTRTQIIERGFIRSAFKKYKYQFPFDDFKCDVAPTCGGQWPVSWYPKYRVSFYKEPAQKELFI